MKVLMKSNRASIRELGLNIPRETKSEWTECPDDSNYYYKLITKQWSAHNDVLIPSIEYLKAYWKAEDLTDSVGSHTLTNNNSVTFTGGKRDNAFTLNGTDQYLTAVDSDDWDLLTSTEYSISMWINADFTDERIIISQIEDSNNYWSLSLKSQCLGVKSRSNGTLIIDQRSTTAIALNTWHHIVLTKDNDNYIIYLNGSQYFTFTSTASDTFTGSLRLGVGDLSWGVYFSSQIDEVGIWKGCGMSLMEVAALYNSGTGAFLI